MCDVFVIDAQQIFNNISASETIQDIIQRDKNIKNVTLLVLVEIYTEIKALLYECLLAEWE